METISSGAASLDMALGVGGLPQPLHRHTGSQWQDDPGFADYRQRPEGGRDCRLHRRRAHAGLCHARAVGVDVDELYLSQPDTGEQALEIVDALVRSEAIDVIVVDWVAAGAEGGD